MVKWPWELENPQESPPNLGHGELALLGLALVVTERRALKEFGQGLTENAVDYWLVNWLVDAGWMADELALMDANGLSKVAQWWNSWLMKGFDGFLDISLRLVWISQSTKQ